MKVSQFSPALLAAWESVIAGTFEVKCGTGEKGRKAAVHLRYRMYRLRTAMQKEHHPLVEAALRCKLQLTLASGEHVLRGGVADEELETLLRNSGVSLPDAPELPLEEDTSTDE